MKCPGHPEKCIGDVCVTFFNGHAKDILVHIKLKGSF